MKNLLASMICFVSAVFAEDYQLRNGSKISGSLGEYKPALLTFNLDSGAIIELPETAFKWADLARILPSNSIYYAYSKSKSKIDDANKTSDLSMEVAERTFNYSKDLLDKQSFALGVVNRYYKADLLPSGFFEEFMAAMEGRPFVKYTNKYGIPEDLLSRIRRNAKDKYPDDFNLQLYVIEQEVKAWKKMND